MSKKTTTTAIPEGFKTVDEKSSLTFQNASNWKKAKSDGVMVQGIYLGLTEEDNYGKMNYKIEATVDGISFDKEGNEVEFSAGDLVIVNDSGNLKRRMDGIAEGSEIIVTYDGTEKMRKGPYKGTAAHQFSVYARSESEAG